MLKRLSPLQIIITFNDKYVVPHAYGALAVLRGVAPLPSECEALVAANTRVTEQVCPTWPEQQSTMLGYQLHSAGETALVIASAGMNGARVYFFSFSAAIARVAASITSLGARAMPSL